jgi:putative YhbY family RNA-binding protein
MKLDLSPDERRALRAQSHHLDPVVMIGNDGLTPAVLHEIDINLNAHGLIKIRVFSDNREGREALLAEIADAMDAAPVQHIGKLLVVYRPLPQPEKKRRRVDPKPVKTTAPRQRRSTNRAPSGVPRAPGNARRERARTERRAADTQTAVNGRTPGARGIPGRRRPRSQS